MELTVEQQVEYDALHKELVAQGGPTIGKLKAAGHKDPDGVARLIELGWANPEEVGTVDATSEDEIQTEDVIDEFEAAEIEAEEAQIAADEAIKVAEDKAKVAESKKPAPCWRCDGDGEWHSTKTGVRAKTSSEPLHDTSRVCPECN